MSAETDIVTVNDPRCRCRHTRAEHAHGTGRCYPSYARPETECDCAAYDPAGATS